MSAGRGPLGAQLPTSPLLLKSQAMRRVSPGRKVAEGLMG